MKRSVIESRLKLFPQIGKDKIESAPLMCCVCSFVLGAVIASFYEVLVPVLFVAAIVIAVVSALA